MHRLRVIPTVVAVAAMCVVTTASVARQAVAIAPADVSIELNNNHVVVPAEWDGRRVWFILDTGAANSFVDLDLATAAGVPFSGRINATGAGAGSTAGAVLAEPVHVHVAATPEPIDVPVRAALDMKDLSAHAGRDFAGVLGADLIRRFVMEIDYEHLHLRFHDHESFHYAGTGATVPMTLKNAFPMVRATLHLDSRGKGDSFDANAILDVGASPVLVVTHPIVVARGLAERLHAGEPQPTGRGVGGPAMGRLVRLPSLSIGGARVTNPVAVLSEANAGVMSTTSVFEVNVGGGFMSRFRMFFDYQALRVIFEPNKHYKEPFEADMSGVALTSDGTAHERVIVETVIPGSPAALAGLEPGDRVVSIDGQDAGALTLERIRQLFRIDKHAYALAFERFGQMHTSTLTTRRFV